MTGWVVEARRRVARGTSGRRAAVVLALVGALASSAAGQLGPDPKHLQGGSADAAGGSLDAFLCCGQTTGGTRIWGISYPTGWRVVLLPDNPMEFYGALFMDPRGSVVVAYIPAATTVPGAVTDVGDVDRFLDGLVAERRQEFRGFEEIQRRPLPGIPAGRLWAGTWPNEQERMWEAALVVVSPTNLEHLLPGMPRGNLTMMGVRAASSEWARGHAIYERMVASTRVRLLDGRFAPWDCGIGRPGVAPGMVRFCPGHCDWIWVDPDRPGWRCPRCGAPTEPRQVPCR